MKTNQIFSIKRFINLIKSDLLMNYKKYGLMILAILLVDYVILYLNMPKYSYNPNNVYNIREYFPLFTSLGFFTLGAWIGSAFPEFNNKNTSRSYLITPASTFEKYTTQLLGRIIISTIIFLIIFWLAANLARFTVLHTIKENIPNIEQFNFSGVINTLKSDSVIEWLLPLSFLALIMFLFSVRIYFNKHGLVKTILSLSVVLFLLYLLFVIFTQVFYPSYKLFEVHSSEYQVTKSLKNSEILGIVILSLSSLILPVLGFFKLKEKEL